MHDLVSTCVDPTGSRLGRVLHGKHPDGISCSLVGTMVTPAGNQVLFQASKKGRKQNSAILGSDDRRLHNVMHDVERIANDQLMSPFVYLH